MLRRYVLNAMTTVPVVSNSNNRGHEGVPARCNANSMPGVSERSSQAVLKSRYFEYSSATVMVHFDGGKAGM